MTQEPDDATRRVVKKVVKRTVTRPLAPAPRVEPVIEPESATARSPRRLRPARLATPSRIPTARSTAPAPRSSAAAPATAPAQPARTEAERPPLVQSAPSPEVTTTPPPAAPTAEPGKLGKHAKPAKARKAPKEPKPAKVTKEKVTKDRPSFDLGGRLSDMRYAITDRISDGFASIGDLIADGWHWLIRLRLPHLSPVRGSAITGVIVGLLAVGGGWGFYQLFSATRGTQAGGGWGFLALVFLSFVAFIVGELLLSGFGVPLPRVISILSILLVLLLVLIFFIKLAAGMWAWLLIPGISAACFVASNAAMQIASQEKNDQRLPWEPTSESHIDNLD